MELVVPKKDLLRLVARCQGVADKKSAMPALSNVLLAAEGNTLHVSATDMYLAISGSTPAEVATSGSVALPARELHDRVKAMPDGPIQLSTTAGAQTTIKAAGSPRRFTIHGIPGADFPHLPKPDAAAPTLSLPVDLLARLIARTHFSISTDETRAHVNSALFEWAGDTVRMVTTDGHRLSKMEATVTGTSATATMLIPLKAIAELRRLADDSRAERTDKDALPTVSITQSGPNAFFDLAGMRFSVKLVDAQFPPYQQVIPKVTARQIRAPRRAFAEALDAVRIAASDRTGGVKLTTLSGLLRVTSESPESGNGFDELPVDFEGPELTIGFNAKYFLDVLNAIDDEEIVLGISGELDPAVLRPATESDKESFVAVVMPMRI
ncbi:MAG: DNA polymerase III subunit beta [Polyangiaceae bacterium]|jgi:DNA polymerase-3 subunit beta|nr:DNA polymerase III subunit beta [Polyangiaceae bacterium]MBK8938329.1 DNA polymerase III subunit beta [Polyangiaceae bacterium]